MSSGYDQSMNQENLDRDEDRVSHASSEGSQWQTGEAQADREFLSGPITQNESQQEPALAQLEGIFGTQISTDHDANTLRYDLGILDHSQTASAELSWSDPPVNEPSVVAWEHMSQNRELLGRRISEIDRGVLIPAHNSYLEQLNASYSYAKQQHASASSKLPPNNISAARSVSEQTANVEDGEYDGIDLQELAAAPTSAFDQQPMPSASEEPLRMDLANQEAISTQFDDGFSYVTKKKVWVVYDSGLPIVELQNLAGAPRWFCTVLFRDRFSLSLQRDITTPGTPLDYFRIQQDEGGRRVIYSSADENNGLFTVIDAKRQESFRPFMTPQGEVVLIELSDELVQTSHHSLRASPYLPSVVSSDIAPWLLEVILKCDKTLRMPDIWERMSGSTRPSISTLNRRRDRGTKGVKFPWS